MRFLILFLFLSLTFGQTYLYEIYVKDIKLKELIEILSRLSKKNFFIDPSVEKELQRETTLKIENPVELDSFINFLLREYDLIAVKERNFYRITKAGEIRKDISMLDEEGIKNLKAFLKERVSPSAQVVIDKVRKVLYVRDTYTNVQVLSRELDNFLLKATEVNYETKVFYIKRFVPLRSVENLIRRVARRKIYLSLSPEFNAIIVTADVRDLKRIERAIERFSKRVSYERPIITKTFYLKFVSVGEFKKLIAPYLSEEGEVFVPGGGGADTETTKLIARLRRRIEELENRKKFLPPQEQAKLEKEIESLKAQELRLLSTLGKAQGKLKNVIIVRDYVDVINRIKERYRDLISEVPVQVKIEARVVEVEESVLRELGVNWFAQFTPQKVPQAWEVGVGGNAEIGGQLSPTPGLSGTPGLVLTWVFSRSYLKALSTRLSAFERVGKAKNLSKPTVFTLDGEKATISTTIQYPIISVTYSPGGTASISAQYKNIPIKLEVTPTLLPNGKVLLDISLSKTNITQEIKASAGGTTQTFPVMSEKRIKSKVIVNNGDVVVIGGVLERSNTSTSAGIPGFHRIPLLGWLFGLKSNQKISRELLIFISPTVVQE